MCDSQAYAGQTFTSRLLAAISGEPNVVECTFVENNLTPAPFFSTPVSPAYTHYLCPSQCPVARAVYW